MGAHLPAVTADKAVVGLIEGVQLHPGHVGEDLHHPAAVRLVGLGYLAVASAVRAEVVIKAAAEAYQVVGAEHIVPQLLGAAEVQWSARHRQQLAGGYQVVGDGGVLCGVKRQVCAQHILLRVSGEVEEAVVRGVKEGQPVRLSPIGDAQDVLRAQLIANLDLYVSGEALLAVGAF